MKRNGFIAPVVAKAPVPPVQSLLGLPFFRGMEGTALTRLAEDINDVNARSGTVLFRRGEPCRGLYIVVSGQVKLSLATPHGSEKVVELVGPGGCFGGSSILLERAHVMTAETLADTRLLLIGKAAVLAELERTPGFTRNFVASLSERMHHLIGALEDCMLRSGTERVIGFLLHQLPAGAADGPLTLTLPAKKGIIASQLNLTHEHFSRILRDLVTQGLIGVEGRNVHVPDVHKLSSRLNGGH
jgi:CRP-like cAMP-binding protein